MRRPAVVTMRSCASHRAERGAVAVEFALVLPLLVMLLMGVTTAGLAFNKALAMSSGVREGSRFAATTIVATTPLPYTTPQWEAWANQVITRSRETMTDSSSGATTLCVQVWKNATTVTANPVAVLSAPRCSTGSQGIAGGSAPSVPAVESASCIVAVWGLQRLEINVLLKTFTPQVRRESIARYERSC